MRRDSVLRSTPFRLALIFAVLFLGAFVITGISVYEFTQWELRGRQDEALLETFAVISAAYGDRDMTDLLDVVGTNIRATRDHERVFLVIGPDGRVLGGNLPAVALPPGWSNLSGRSLGLENELRYRLYSGTVDGTKLVVGSSLQEIDELQEIVLSSFAWASIVVGLLAVAGGALIARQVQRRFGAVRETMERVAHGELSARIPLLGKGDDIDFLSQDINEALGRLATTVEGMRQVSTDIAHDLKTPLNRLKLVVEEALTDPADQGAVRQALESASEEADQINRTFEALLRIAQIETGARRARFAPVDLAGLLGTVVEIYRDVAEDAGQTMRIETGDTPDVLIEGDRELLMQMYANLVENAIRHCPAKTAIRIAMTRRRDAVLTTVQDDGPGVPEAERGRVFRRLYRLEKSRTSPGTGLGLSLVKAVADLHDATIRLDDAGPGLRVEIAFPLRRHEAPE